MDFAARRLELLRRLGSGAVAIATAAPEVVRSNDTHFTFRQDSDFHYLTGFDEPEAVVVLSAVPGAPPFTVFVRPRDPERETWDGPRAGVDGARERLGADRAHAISDLAAALPDLLERAERVAFTPGRDQALAATVEGAVRAAQQKRPKKGTGPTAVTDLGYVLHEMRLIKEPAEIERMRRAVELSARGHAAALAAARPGMREYEIEALLSYEFRRGGGSGPAYPPIVASGPNACILHSIANTRRMSAGDLLLIDAGAEFDYYAADVTRTFPVSGRFTAPQRAVYEIVLEAQRAALDRVRPGARFTDPHDAALRVLCQGLVDLGVLSGAVDDIVAGERYKPYYMHRTGHWLGMDVHDVGASAVGDAPRALEPGMVLTVEPGLYFAPHLEDVPAAYRGIGIRIEDDVLITPAGREVLSAAIPKTLSDLEAALAARGAAPVTAPD